MPPSTPGSGPDDADLAEEQPRETVDARGLHCPVPVILAARVARTAVAGTLVTVLATDPAARHDVPAWARMRGHDLVELTDGPDGLVTVVVRILAPA